MARGFLDAPGRRESGARGAFAGLRGSAFSEVHIFWGDDFFACRWRLVSGGHGASILCGPSRFTRRTSSKTSALAPVKAQKSAGGGTRTLKLFRAPAPKAGMFANFITPAAVPIVPPRTPTNLSVVPHSVGSSWRREGRAVAIRGGVRSRT